MKKQTVRLFAAVLCLCMVLPCAVSAAGLDQFKPKNTYSDSLFTDVPASAWYYSDIKTCYELGLMGGYTDRTFRPSGYITLAECVVIAARIHNIYRNGLGVFDQSGFPWYDIPVKYAISSKIIRADDFADYSKNATRAQMAYIFSAPLPASELSAVNTIEAIPDVTAATQYRDAIYMLYRAGVLTGRGSEGYFDPAQPITRAEAAAIISRMIVPANRKSLTLLAPSDPTLPAEPTDPVVPSDPAEPVDPDDALNGNAFMFTDVQSFSEGLAVVSYEDSHGYIDTNGELLCELAFSAAYPFSEGKGVVLLPLDTGGNELGYLDRDGDYTSLGIVIGSGTTYTGTEGRFSDGCLLLEGAVPALIDTDGNLISVGSGYVPAAPVGDGLICVRAAAESTYPDLRYLDADGRTVIDLTCACDLPDGMGEAVIEAGAFRNGMAPVRIGSFIGGRAVSTQWGFIDLTGKIVFSGITARNEQASVTFEGGVTTGKLTGGVPAVITASGSVIRLDDYSSVLAPSAHSPLIGVCSGGRWGFVTKTGRTAVELRFDKALPFSGGLAAVVSNGNAGFIDENGDWAFSPIYDDVRSFNGGFGWGKSGEAWYILEY